MANTENYNTVAAETATLVQAQSSQTVLETFDSWPGGNSLNEFSSAGAFENGDGSGEVVDGALRLEYDDTGWFCSNVRADRSDDTHLELVVRGDDGGEEDEVYLEIDAVEAPLSDLTSDSIGTEFDTVSVDLEAAGVETASVQDVWLTFWDAGSGALEIEEIRFVDRGDPISVGDYDTRDTTGDGLHNDFTGDGQTSHDDVTAFFENLEADEIQDNPEAFDFAENDDVGFSDVVELLRGV
ncbi:hypothetical protein [Natronolimnobius baerhuensis]|uniref:Uncharacterized protein n=1 Tax=Natronolimnobius baerhuensis TaxID=253108 RepID=A0A202E5X6_9EURY|nr:hypothetical protein [Natronolimnobius baerhuensis]OVE83594.1 hypothetical protein B2G88_14260 [Natronolimnobius baerhuensis]